MILYASGLLVYGKFVLVIPSSNCMWIVFCLHMPTAEIHNSVCYEAVLNYLCESCCDGGILSTLIKTG